MQRYQRQRHLARVSTLLDFRHHIAHLTASDRMFSFMDDLVLHLQKGTPHILVKTSMLQATLRRSSVTALRRRSCRRLYFLSTFRVNTFGGRTTRISIQLFRVLRVTQLQPVILHAPMGVNVGKAILCKIYLSHTFALKKHESTLSQVARERNRATPNTGDYHHWTPHNAPHSELCGSAQSGIGFLTTPYITSQDSVSSISIS